MTNSNLPVPSHPLRWLPEFWELSQKRFRPQARIMGLALLVGIISGLGATVFYTACQIVAHYALDGMAGYRPDYPGGEPPIIADTLRVFTPWLLIVIPTIGGILSGIMVFTLAPEAEGHGTDAAIAAFHFRRGQIRFRVPFIKLISSAITIGSGGSGGREGPIALIGAGFGSFIGTKLHLNSTERRILMAAGMGAGIAAIFRAPLAGALFAAEILYRSIDFEADVIVPAALASTAAYCTFGLVFGWESLFTLSPQIIQSLSFQEPGHLLSYLLLAIFIVILAMIYTKSFYAITHAFRYLHLPRHIKPAIGGFATGLVGLGLFYLLGRNQQVLAVLSSGYGTLQDALNFQSQGRFDLLLALMFIAVALGKILTTGLTIGSGGSGGVFGPSMVIGGCGGGALGIVLHYHWPTLVPHPSCFVIVGMAGFFTAAAKTPVSTLVIVSEMTGNYSLLLPTLWVSVIAFLLSDEQSIYNSQALSRSLSPAHQGDYVREVLAGLKVKEFLTPQQKVSTLKPEERLPEIIERLSKSSYHGLPVTDGKGKYLGMVSLEEVHLASLSPSLNSLVVAMDLMREDIPPLRPEYNLDKALEIFVESDRTALAVVSPAPENCVIGIVKRADISSAYLRRVHGSTVSK